MYVATHKRTQTRLSVHMDERVVQWIAATNENWER